MGIALLKNIFFSLLFFSLTGFSQTLLDLNKFMIFPTPDGFTQTEPVATFHPSNSSMIFASAVTFKVGSLFKSEGIYVSLDGGYMWTGNDTCTGESIINHGGDPGVAITQNGRFVLTHIALSPFTGMYSNFSDDSGKTWSDNNLITSNQSEDKGTLAIDHSGQSSYQGRLYLTWVNYVDNPYAVRSSVSTDNGESWSLPLLVNPNRPSRSSGTSMAVANDGTVYLCWAGVTLDFPFHEDYVGFANSTNGGTSWNVNQNIFDMNGIAGLLSEKSNIKVNGIPQIGIDNSGGLRDGWLYIITTEINNAPAGSDPDIILHRSTDGGAAWSAGIRVNQDPLNNGKIQYFPNLDVDEYGNLNILFYDDRNTTSDSASVFLTQSIDGGDSWTEFEISNTTFKPKPIAGGSSNYQGDHIALISNDSQLNAFWMADYTGIYQVWSAVINRNVLGVEDQMDYKPNSFSLAQNYPNPFNPTTKIRYQIPNVISTERRNLLVSIKVFDVLGKEVATLVNEEKSPGNYEVEFNASSLVSGIYFYQLKAVDPESSSGQSFVDTRKMILLK